MRFLALLLLPAGLFAADAPAPLSPSPEALSPSATVTVTVTLSVTEEGVEDDLSATAAVLDYGLAETRLLAKVAEGVKPEDESVLHNLEENARVEKAGPGVAELGVEPLYAELAKRTLEGDKEARQALTLAVLRGDKRAKAAKDLAYEDKQAMSFIKRAENGDGGARAELEKLAAKGNRKARAFLGLDGPQGSPTPTPEPTELPLPTPVPTATKIAR